MKRIKSFQVIGILLAALVISACGGNAEPSSPPAVPTVTGLPSNNGGGNAPDIQPPEGYPAPEATPLPEGYPARTPTVDPYASP